MKNFLLLFLIFSLNLYASGIQQQDIKTEAQCISAGATAANCLPLSSQIYDAVLGKKLSTILDSGSLGSATAAVGQVLTANGSGGSYWGSGIAVFPPVITTYTS